MRGEACEAWTIPTTSRNEKSDPPPRKRHARSESPTASRVLARCGCPAAQRVANGPASSSREYERVIGVFSGGPKPTGQKETLRALRKRNQLAIPMVLRETTSVS